MNSTAKLEKCPKCRGKMMPNGTGYAIANVSNGFGTPIPESYSCMSCGKYIEVFDDAQYVGKKSNYPKVRKPMGEPGWLRTLVLKKFKTIQKMRGKDLSWETIANKFNRSGTLPEVIDFISLSNIYRRVVKEKRGA